MHGLNTIVELNELAAQNQPAAVAKMIDNAVASRSGDGPSRMDIAIDEKLAARKIERETLIKELARKDTFELLEFVKDSNCPTVLEKALANKLAFLAANMEAGYVGNRQMGLSNMGSNPSFSDG